VNEDLDVAEAKSATQAVENQIVDAVPAQFVFSRHQIEAGSFLSCGDGGHSWSGFAAAEIANDPDPGDVLDPIGAVFAEQSGFATASREDQGDQLLDVRSDDGTLWIVRYDRARAELSVNSFSACLRLPDDIWPGSPY